MKAKPKLDLSYGGKVMVYWRQKYALSHRLGRSVAIHPSPIC